MKTLQENAWFIVATVLAVQFGFSFLRRKSLDANTKAIKKLNKDINKNSAGLKVLAGDTWSTIAPKEKDH